MAAFLSAVRKVATVPEYNRNRPNATYLDLTIPLRSMEEVLTGLDRPVSPLLIGIVSRSETILKWASLLFPALGITDCDLVHRNHREPKWWSGLGACDLILADILAARELPKTISPIALRLVAHSFFEEARKLVTAEKVYHPRRSGPVCRPHTAS